MNGLDIFFFAVQPMNLLPILLYFNSMSGKRDGLTWLIEDVAPNLQDRSVLLNTFLFLFKSAILIPCFCATCRAMQFTSLGYLAVITSIKELAYALLYNVQRHSDFFQYYSQFFIISSILR